jgi:type I restriction enzyme S subunit
MVVTKGYKQSEVGVIPEDWDVKFLPQVTRFRGGKAHEQFISEAGDYVCVNSKFISSNGKVLKHCFRNFCCARLNDILMVMSDLPNGKALAKAFVANADNRYAVNQRVCSLTAYRDCPHYLFYILNRNPYFLKFDDGVNQTHLLNRVFQKCPIPLPPTLAEQEAIASALSDADAWIESLEQLIAKKRQIKQGAMQELLTGKRRLPGFSGEWETKRLGDYCQFLRNGTNSRAELSAEGKLKYLHYGDIHSCHRVYISPDRLPSLAVSKGKTLDRLQDGDLVLADASEDTAGISKSVEIVDSDGFDLVAGLHTIAVRFTQGTFAPGYAGCLQHCPDFYTHLRMLAAGTKVFATNRRHIASAELGIPTLDEQTAIATVLSDMDTEIESLESKLAKAREIKQGMMHELLTGRIRLV